MSLPTLSSEERLRRAPFLTVSGTSGVGGGGRAGDGARVRGAAVGTASLRGLPLAESVLQPYKVNRCVFVITTAQK